MTCVILLCMSGTDVQLAVKSLIEQAASSRGWSIAELTRRVGKGASTLHRWRSGDTTCYDLPALIEICKLADASLDETFGIDTAGVSRFREMHSPLELSSEERARQLNNLKGLTQAISSIVATLEIAIEAAMSAPRPDAADHAKFTYNRLKGLDSKRRSEAAREEGEIERPA